MKKLCRLCIFLLTVYAVAVSIIAGYWRGYAQAVEYAQATKASVAFQESRRNRK